MSPALKSKSKDKATPNAGKEHSKTLSKSSVTPVNGGNGAAASAYDPVSGTFHAIESMPPVSAPTPQSNGRFRNIDETEENSGSSLGTAAEYDSVSNNDSCSGESEDQQKEKSSNGLAARSEPNPGSDIEKREKIRQRNEKKHQRQKEKRAQELHERCCGYLTSRKLETLAQKLVAMGFTSDQATMALIQNEGRVEESALWLTEGGEESKRLSAVNLDGVSPKINITDELARITVMESIFKCTKQEVERAVVACEGDLEKAAENLRRQKQEPAGAPPKLEESGDHPNPIVFSANGLHSSSRLATSSQSSVVRTQPKGVAPSILQQQQQQQQRRDDRDFNYTKAAGTATVEAANRNLQSARKVQQQPDWAKPPSPVPLEKRWPDANSNPSTPYSASTVQVAAALSKPEHRYMTAGSSDLKANMSGGTLREPIIMMQRGQSNVTRPNLPSALGASPPTSTGWYPNNTSAVEMMKLANGGGLGRQLRNLALNGSNSQQFIPGPRESNGTGWGTSWNMQGTTTTRPSSSSSASLAVPSSLGLFTGWGSTGGSGALLPPVDWSTRGLMPPCDYTSIDWSLDSTPLPLPSSSIKGERLYDNMWHALHMAPTPKAARTVVSGGGGGMCIAGMQDGSLMVDRPAPSGGSHEWTSPFGGKDLFRVPRQFVTSPSP